MEKIDFVIPWVDNTDPEWQKSFEAYLPQSSRSSDTREIRYRNWENLKYWFRGVEKFAPWVNKVHFIPCGHKPDWLNLNAPKLHFVKHSDYIPSEYLPTFSTRPILLNIHRIESLSEQFVCFDDDCFLINNVAPERFFKGKLPCDKAVMKALIPWSLFSHNILSNICVINASFYKPDVVRKNWRKWFSPEIGCQVFQTMIAQTWSAFSGFYDHHFPQGYLKSTLREVWKLHEDVLLRTTAEKFRTPTDVTPWLFRYWQLARGDFVQLDLDRDSKYFEISDRSIDEISLTIKNQTINIIVVNDGDTSSFLNTTFEGVKEKLNTTFTEIFPEKSSFEL